MRASEQKNIARAGIGFTAIDACMTGAYGWLYQSSLLLAPVYCVVLALASVVLAFMPTMAARVWISRFRLVAMPIMLFYTVGFFLNFMSNYGLTAAMSKDQVVQVQNNNTVALDKRQAVERLRKQRATLTRQIEFAAHLGAPKSYTKQIEALELSVALETKRGGCKSICEKKTKELAQAVSDKANAQKRETAIADRNELDELISSAETISATNQKTTSAAVSQAEALATLFSRKLDPEKTTVNWTMLWAAVAISALVSVLGHMCNLVAAMNLAGIREKPEPEEEHNAPYADNRWLPDHRAPEDRDPIPLRPHGNSTSTTTINATLENGKPNPYTVSSVDQMLQEVKIIMARNARNAA